MNIAQTNKLGSSQFSFRPINDVEVKSVIEVMKPNKAAGHDSIFPKAVKASASTISQPLSVLINPVIYRSQVPKTSKRGDISPIHKKESTLDKLTIGRLRFSPPFQKFSSEFYICKCQSILKKYFTTTCLHIANIMAVLLLYFLLLNSGKNN